MKTEEGCQPVNASGSPIADEKLSNILTIKGKPTRLSPENRKTGKPENRKTGKPENRKTGWILTENPPLPGPFCKQKEWLIALPAEILISALCADLTVMQAAIPTHQRSLAVRGAYANTRLMPNRVEIY